MRIHQYPEDLLDCEALIADTGVLLLRQITNRNWDDVNKVPMAPAFGPENSARRPSFARGIDPQAARDWHQKNATSSSVGVWAVSGAEVLGQGLRVVDDSNCPDPDNTRAPGHCYVDYRGLSKSDKNSIQAYLTLKAVSRGELPTSDIGHHLASTP